MTTYEYDNLPDELNVDVLPKELFQEAYAAFTQALEADTFEAMEIKAAYVYDRKGYLDADTFGGKRNAYGSTNDDVVLQLTIRIPNPSDRKELDKVANLEQTIVERNLNAERARLEAEIVAEEAAAEKAQATAKQKREQLKALRPE